MLKRSSFSNYETNILSTIQLNLDNYKYGSGFTILKELIQNASDANATKIVIRSFTAVPNAHCPLLKRAGIVVYNNGKFDEDDAKNIAMFGGDNKKNDATTIGRYGFGLKSIYHLCDAFIYYGHKDKLINGLSPLKGKDDDGNSGEFADLTEDDEKALVEQFEKEQDGLSFFIPVDGKNKIGSEPVDPKHPFNRNEKGCSELIQNIILTFAILSKSSKGTKLKEFRYDLGDCNILLNVNENNCRLSLNFQDEIVVPFSSLRDVVGESIFANEEQKRVVNELARRLAKCDYEGSLKTKKKIVDFGKSINELAEERLRGTTVLQLLRIPRIVQDEKINLRLSFASYLPLPKQEKIGEIKRIDCDFNYAVIIHAPFAIDSGRKNIYKFDTICHHRVEMNDFENVEYSLDEEKPLHRWWNRILFQSILAPSLPSLLDKALKDGVLLEQDVKDVGKKLYDLLQQGEDGEKRRLEYVNAKNVFVRRINAGGVKEWILLQVERGGRYIHIPETDDSKLLNWLTKMAGSMDVLLLTDTVSTLPPTIKFDLNAFEQLLATIPSELFEDELIIEFLHKLILINGINKTRLHSDLNLKNCIRTAILRALANLGVAKVMTSINKIKDLCSVIEFYEIQNIDILDDEWTYLWEKDNPFILLPSQTLVHNNCNIEYDFDEFLYFLCICAEENKLSGKAQLSVIQAIAGDSIKSVLSKIERDYRSNLKVFKVQKIQYDRGKNILNNTIDFLDYNAVLKINLFREFDFSDSSHIICKLVKLIENENLYMVENADVNRSAFLNKFARSANKAGALDYLKEKYQQYLAISNDEDIRKDFLESIFDRNSLLENIRPEYSGIYTFLLMGFKETQSKICILKPNCSEVWKKIYEDCLKKDNKAIELLTLSENQKKFVENHNTLLKNITWLDNNECQEMLVHFSQGNNLDFMKTEYYQNESNRKQIFEVINEPKRNLYYRIPLHKNEKGEFVSFVPGSTWYNKHNIEFEVDVPSLEGKIIPCEKDDLLRSKQDSFFISDSDRNRYEILTQGAALREFLISYKFEPRILRNCCDWILERMQRYVTFSDKELSQIDSICWIPLKNSENLCSIKDILTTDRCSQESFAILKESLNFILLEDVDINDDKKKYITGFLKRRNLDLIDEINVRIQEKYSNYYFPIEDKDEKQRIFNLAINNLTQKNKILKIYAVIGSDSKLKISKEELLKNYCQLRIPGAFDYENGIELLNTLTENTRCEDDALKLFNHILKLIKDNPNFKLSDIRRFPNAENELEREWKLATELIAVPQCSDSHSIGQKLYKRDNLCSSETYDLISNYIPQNDMVQRLPKATDAEIKEVVDFWRQNCKQPKLVSLALYLMQGKFRRMAGALEDSILGKLDEFCRDEFTIPSSHVNKLFPTEESKRNRFRTFDEINVTANVISQSTNKAMSLAGTCEEFPINPKVTYDPNVNLDLISKTFNVRLLKSSGINTDESIKCLIETLLWNIYKIDVKKAFLLKNEFFKLIDETSQYTIKAAQKHIRREIFSTLHFLNVKHKEYKRLNNEINRLDNKDENSESESQKEWDLRNEMLETVIREPDLQRYIFDRVCHKIKEHQYFSSSILFELFQNADDCVNDFLKAPEDIALKYADKKKFEVHFDSIAKRLEIIHYGRKINQSFPEVDDDIANSFKRDLQNMLSIASSEKSQENGQTGKFGLGFKSVYTVCDEPVVRSGDLQFKIIAGIYPDENIEYDKTCDDCTKIELKCRDDIDVENDCFAEFEKCAAFLTVFSKQINKIYLLDKVIEPEYQNVCELSKSETAIKKVKLNGEVFLLVDHRDCEVLLKCYLKN
ncbi:sacsin N-terminal ATP-binding-like domain-containing protein [Fibrobacter succinogenes]|uniref:sacsin N-terminal ATP-binding-like domain-containing protein n=1 Tax=Fibrobacter succinogenes TaxID=833 RepID=UPI0002F83E85|nr:ATP-binding protein [Fibrobacter succinogenes]